MMEGVIVKLKPGLLWQRRYLTSRGLFFLVQYIGYEFEEENSSAVFGA
jgi:hypothetical protein